MSKGATFIRSHLKGKKREAKYRSSTDQKRSKVQLGRDRDKAEYRSYLEEKERSKVQIKREARYSWAGIETKQSTDHI